MRDRLSIVRHLAWLGASMPSAVCATMPVIEATGSIGIEARLFNRAPALAGQRWHAGALVFNPGWIATIPSMPGLSARLTPYARLDTADAAMRYVDLREATVRYQDEESLFQVGVETVDWSVMESSHPVNVINQIDTRADVNLEAKLGQPMVSYTRFSSTFGRLSAYWMPWFRPRPLLGAGSRQRIGAMASEPFPHGLAPWFRTNDVALRWSATLGTSDLSLYAFDGRSREPNFAPDLTTSYQRIRQFGATAQIPSGNMLWKGEAIYRFGQGRPFVSWVAGAEYTITRSAADVSLLLEALHDDRDASAPPAFYKQAAFGGVRLRLNEPGDAELLYGLMYDRVYRVLMHRLTFSRRFGQSIRLWIEARKASCDSSSPFAPLCHDSVLQLNLSHNF